MAADETRCAPICYFLHHFQANKNWKSQVSRSSHALTNPSSCLAHCVSRFHRRITLFFSL
jgi:hypothetical protein